MDSVDVTFGHRLWWVDTFIGERERGNPASVVLLEHSIPDAELQRVAAEMGASETAFLQRSYDGWALRWFTPTVEIDLGGHAALAAVHVVLNELNAPEAACVFHTRAGRLSGKRQLEGMLAVDLPRVELDVLDPDVLDGALGEVTELYRAGATTLLAVVKDYDALCDLDVDPVRLFLVPGSVVIAACEGGPDVDVCVRVFAPRLGVVEDAVTGSALCAISPWWVERVGAPTVSVRQASARGGVLYARLFERNVEVAGRARTFFAGEIRR